MTDTENSYSSRVRLALALIELARDVVDDKSICNWSIDISRSACTDTSVILDGASLYKPGMDCDTTITIERFTPR